MADNQDINGVLYVGDYYANAWVNVPASGSGIYSLREMRQHGDGTDSTRIQYAFFYAITAGRRFLVVGGSSELSGVFHLASQCREQRVPTVGRYPQVVRGGYSVLTLIHQTFILLQRIYLVERCNHLGPDAAA